MYNRNKKFFLKLQEEPVKTNLKYSELERLCLSLNCKIKTSKGSHVSITHDKTKMVLIVARHSQHDLLKPYSVKSSLRFIKSILEEM